VEEEEASIDKELTEEREVEVVGTELAALLPPEVTGVSSEETTGVALDFLLVDILVDILKL
jgi:hypothetical protein